MKKAILKMLFCGLLFSTANLGAWNLNPLNLFRRKNDNSIQQLAKLASHIPVEGETRQVGKMGKVVGFVKDKAGKVVCLIKTHKGKVIALSLVTFAVTLSCLYGPAAYQAAYEYFYPTISGNGPFLDTIERIIFSTLKWGDNILFKGFFQS